MILNCVDLCIFLPTSQATIKMSSKITKTYHYKCVRMAQDQSNYNGKVSEDIELQEFSMLVEEQNGLATL